VTVEACSVVPIGVLRTCWPDRWGVPRQAGLVPASWAVLELASHVPTDAIRGLEASSHVWLITWMHAVRGTRWTVRPPRLGGERLGVLATRGPHRPSRLGLSAVTLVEVDAPGRRLVLSGHDFADQTPVLDVKPYVPWADAIPGASTSWAPAPPAATPVRFSEAAEQAVAAQPALRALIAQTLAADPRQGSRDWSRVVVRVEAVDVAAIADGDTLLIERIVPWEARRDP
jgi:tRNA-Thr(GGU) m(6)t(6)A37 methyltransferase TsaA